MNIIRPIHLSDLECLYQIAVDTGPGFTSLPVDAELLRQRILHAEQALSQDIQQSGPARYLFVMQDTETGQVTGTCGIDAAVGLSSPWYHYRIGTLVHASRELNIHNSFQTLYLCNDYTGCSELCTLYLHPGQRHSGNGALLSKSRFLFMAEHPTRFAPKIISELRGFTDQAGVSPFWEGLGKRFFSMEYSKADYLTGAGNKVFIAELMPKHSIYIHLLPEDAQAVIAQVHPDTEPARRMLEAEGFRYENYVDIFDAGPTVAAHPEHIRAIQHSRYRRVLIGQVPDNADEYLISNTRLKAFRCTKSALSEMGDQVTVTAETAQALQVNAGDQVRIVELKRRSS
ncbi:MAG: arginine N-succinyltransferase [Pontibacterium sp.]